MVGQVQMGGTVVLESLRQCKHTLVNNQTLTFPLHCVHSPDRYMCLDILSSMTWDLGERS